MPAALTAWVFRSAPDAATSEQLRNFALLIRDVLGSSNLAISFSPGTAGRHRKWTAQVSDTGRVIAYVKIGTGAVADRLLKQEADNLSYLEAEKFDAAILPRLIALERRDAHCLLFQGAPKTPLDRRPLEADNRDAAFLAALASTNRQNVPLSDLLERLSVGTFVKRLEAADPEQVALLNKSLETICRAIGSSGVETSLGHGDYAPWNTLALDKRRLYVFDWEFGGDACPLLADLFHRILMPSRLVYRLPTSAVIGRLLLSHDHPFLGDVVRHSGVSRRDLHAYVLLYLVSLAVREEEQNDEVSSYLLDGLSCCLDTVARRHLRRKVLVAAYACEPGRGSEPAVGWNVCQAISRNHEVWVITKANNQAPIEAELARRPNANLHFIYVGLPSWLSFWKKGQQGIRTYYYLWQFAAWRKVRELGREIRFDIAHHVTFVNDWMFSFLALLPYPFVWGPIGSHPKIPSRLAPRFSALLYDRFRYALKSGVRIVDPLFWLCAHRAAVIAGIDAEVASKFPLSWLGRRKFINYPAIGVEALFDRAEARDDQDERGFHVLTVGRLVPVKGFHLAIHAFARFVSVDRSAKLLIVGDGAEREPLERLARNIGVQESVEFRPWLPRNDVLIEMRRADAFLFPSSEGGGMVVLEAMAHGVPTVCLDYGGPGRTVTRDCGFAVAVGTMEETVAGLAHALATLVKDASLSVRFEEAARQRVVNYYLWENRSHSCSSWYSVALLASRR